MKKFTFLLILLTVSFGYSQQIVLENFEGAAPTLNGWDGASASIVTDPATGGTNGNVLQIVSTAGGQFWQGGSVLMQYYKIKLTSDKTAKIDVYSTQAFNLLAKVENGGPNSAVAVSYTTPNAWQTLTINFGVNPLDGTTTANGEYMLLALFPNWGTGAWGPAANKTIYVDNITAEGTAIVVVPDPAPTVAAPTPPVRNAWDVKSIFSDAYTNVAVLGYTGDDNTYNTSWCGATTALYNIPSVVDNPVHKVTGLGCEGVAFQAGRFDATAFTHFHMDIWTSTATLDKSFNVKFSNWNGGAGEANAIEYSGTNANFLTNPNPGTWISIDLPLSSWTPIGNANRNDLVQFVISSDLGTVYYDNLYLYRAPTAGTDDLALSDLSVYPNPTSNVWNIDSNFAIKQVMVYDTLGKLIKVANADSSNVQIDASSFTNGIYLAKVQTERGSKTIKLIKN